MKPIMFLDIDGVLNVCKFDDVAKSTGIKRKCILQLNRIIHAVDPGIVISSAWRYMILGKAMTLNGFQYLLRTHGLTNMANIIGVTRKDSEPPIAFERGCQITEWLAEHPDVTDYVVIDDRDLGILEQGHPFVKTLPSVGMRAKDADRVIEILTSGTTGRA